MPRATISPRGDDRHPVGEALRLVHVVGGEEDRLAEVAQAGDHVPGLAPRRGVEAGGRLVEEEQLGVADQRHADVEAALLAAGEPAGPVVRLALQPDQLDHLVDRAAGRCSSRRRGRATRAPSGRGRAGRSAGRSRSARATRAPRAAGPRRAPRPPPRCACGSPRGSRPWSSCRRRWGRGRRRPRRARPRGRCRAPPRCRRSSCAGRDGDDGIGHAPAILWTSGGCPALSCQLDVAVLDADDHVVALGEVAADRGRRR